MKNEETNAREILAKLLDYVKISRRQLQEKLGTKALDDIARGRTQGFSFEVASKICAAYPEINFDWVTGRSDVMFVENNGNSDGSPYYTEFTIQGGLGHGSGSEQAIEPSGYINVPQIKCSPNVAFFQVKGDSMLNSDDPTHSVPDGAWIALKPVLTDVIQWGHVYAFETADGPIVKMVEESDKEGYIRCVSFNPRFKPFDMRKSDIIDGTFCHVEGAVEIKTLN